MEESVERVKEYLKNFEGEKEDFEAILNILNGYIESKSDKEIETSDKNVENIEEDIKYVKEMLEIARVFFKAVKAETNYKDVDDVAFCNAVEHILAEREQDKKRIQELEAENKKLKEVRVEYDYGYEFIHFCTKNDLVRIDKNKYLIEIKDGKFIDIKQLYIDSLDSIPKQKVKDKIEKLRNDIKLGNCRYPYVEEHKIDILQELLEGEEVKDVK